MLYKASYGSHLPVLIKVVSSTSGSVLELGAGIYSTPVLHWMCYPKKRELISYDNDAKYLKIFNLTNFESDFHKIIHVKDWDAIEIERGWDVVFIDHKPAERRKVEAARLAEHALYVILHDTHWRNEKHYNYKEIYPLFKHRFNFCAHRDCTTVLSNFIDLKGFGI